MDNKIKILDTTLRDGLQSQDISFSVSDKLNIVKILDAFGVSYIEAGNPASNPKDVDFFVEASKLKLKKAKLCAFGSTRRKNCDVHEDMGIKSLLEANTSVVVVFGKTWDMHVKEILGTTLKENLKMIEDSISFLKECGKEVIFDAEHFFDGYKHNQSYTMQVIKTAVKAGADSVCLCDTNGGFLPFDIYEITGKIKEIFPEIEIGIHTHNDSGCSVANSLLGVKAGATQVQGTFLGFGERCGNSDLSSIIPNLVLKQNIKCDGDIKKLVKTANAIAEIANVKLENNKPYVGKGAFTHKAGMHIDGVLKNSETFEHISPDLVGNKRRFLISEVAGRGTVLQKIKSFAPDIKKDSPLLEEIMKKLKDMEYFGYQFEAADASFELLVKKILGDYKPHFSLVFYKTIGDFPAVKSEQGASAIIKIDVDGKTEMTADSGNGPVNALDGALRKALSVFYPSIKRMRLTDYKVRVLEQNCDTAAKVRVLIESSDRTSSWSTIGVSHDIIEASLLALIDSFEYKLSKGK